MNDNRNSGIDIIKAIATIFIISFHFYPTNGAYITVYIFFVFSGYFLANSLLAADFIYQEYLLKKIKRTYPLLIAVLLSTTIVYYFVCGGLDKIFKYNALSSFVGLSNVYQSLSKLSYFELYDSVNPLIHTWYLSIDLQFALIFPIFIILFKNMKLSKKTMSGVFFLLSLLSACYAYYLYIIGTDLSVIYYSTSVRIGTLFLGASFSAYFFEKELKHKKFMKFLSVLGLIAILYFIYHMTYEKPLNYYGFLYIFSIFIAIITLTIAKTDFLNNDTFFISKFLSKLGKRSYSYYLWQFPLMVFSSEYFKWTKIPYNITILIQVLILLILSEFSYRYIENNQNFNVTKVFSMIFLTLIILIPNADLQSVDIMQNQIIAQTISQEEENLEMETPKSITFENDIKFDDIEQIPKILDVEQILEKVSEEKLALVNNDVEQIPEIVDVEQVPETISEEKLALLYKDSYNKNKITFIGDSVMEMSKDEIFKNFPKSYIDAKVSRQFIQLPKILDSLIEKEKLNDIVVIHLGGNGLVSDEAFEIVMEKLKNKQVFFINSIVGKYWEKSINDFLSKNVKKYNNAEIIDWHSFGKGKSKWFYKDATHLKPNGAREFSSLIYRNMNEFFNPTIEDANKDIAIDEKISIQI